MKDPYVLEDGTLKNLLGITDYNELRQAEKDIAFVNLISARSELKKEMGIDLIKDVHKHIFQDIYPWAGEFRTTPIYKEELVIPGLSLEYTSPKNIEMELNSRLKDLNSYKWEGIGVDQIAEQLTHHLAKIWRVHPFRDGNTRTTLTFAEIFAKQHGFELDLGNLLDNLDRIYDQKTGEVLRYSVRDKFVLAALDEKDYPEPEHLKAIIKESIHLGINKKIESLNEMLER